MSAYASKRGKGRIAMITLVTHRPGPGFDPGDQRYRRPQHPPLLPETCARLYRDTLNYVNNYIRPQETSPTVDAGLNEVQEVAQAYMLREGKLGDAQADELAFQLEVLRRLEPGTPEHWKELLAAPGLRFLQSSTALVDYEYGLIYLAICCLERRHDAARTESELRNLLKSWSLTMEPGTGWCSHTLLGIALQGTLWWSRLAGEERDFHRGVELSLLGGIDGAVASVSAQLLEGHRQVDWNQACLGLLQGSLSYAIPAIPAIRAWRERLESRISSQEAGG
jgi:hypothetical protein